jgi:hypothetical protein
VVYARVDRFFFCTQYVYPNGVKMPNYYQITKWPLNIPTGRIIVQIYQHFPFLGQMA